MDINTLFTEAGMRTTTSAWRDTHMHDAQEYGQVAQIIAARLRQERIDGDRGAMSAKRRAWKVSREARRMARLSNKLAAIAEGMNAVYVTEVVQLPARREAAAARREIAADKRAVRRQQRALTTGAAVAKSLHKTATTLGGEQVKPQVSAPVVPDDLLQDFVDPQPFPFQQAAGGEGQNLGSISDFFTSKEARR